MSIHFIHTMNLNSLSSNPTAVACDLGHKHLIIQTSLTDNAEHVKVDGRGALALQTVTKPYRLIAWQMNLVMKN